MQTVFRLRVDRQSGESIRAHAWRQQRLNSPLNTVRQHDAFAALLKRQADEVMRAVTECPPAAVPANVARLRDIEETIQHALKAGLVDSEEAQLSGPNLLHLHTLADYSAAIEITRRDLRAPAFASRWSTELAELHAGLDAIQRQNEALAALVALRNGGGQ